MENDASSHRRLGLLGAVGIGVGAIVGGGILALAGAAFAATGPSAIVAFALNGVIALFTALSFAEVSSKFPESGGTYAFAKKVLSIEAAFLVGWVVWFASIVAATLYALGFAEFARRVVIEFWDNFASPPGWLAGNTAVRATAIAATLAYVLALLLRPAGGGGLANISKVVVFAILIASGLWFARERSADEVLASMRPFLAEGWPGLLSAMGFTFIALQGFDLIAAVAGEIREPERVVPRAMLISLGIALVIYLPLLFVITVVGTPGGESITELSRRHGESIVAVSAESFLGPFGYWLVMVAAILSMASALQANLFAASRVAVSMARDRTLPQRLGRLHEKSGSPQLAVITTALLIIVLLLLVSDVAVAGAAASLIFLVNFALAHWIAILVRGRSGERQPPFRVPFFPLLPAVGGVACVALALYQGTAVQAAGLIAASWLGVGGLLFLGLFSRRARVADASSAALDPELLRLRGRTPLVLVPLANPASARGLVTVASALAPPAVGRVLLLSVVVARQDWRPGAEPQPLTDTQHVLREAITASVETGLYPEALATIATQPWQEISRVARAHQCESILLGLSQLSDDSDSTPIDAVMSEVDCDIVVLRAAEGWQLTDVRRILIPVAGRGGHDELLARLLGSLSRGQQREVTFVRVLRRDAGRGEQLRAERDLARTAVDLRVEQAQLQVVRHESPADVIADLAAASDLVVLGVQRVHRRQKLFGQFTMAIARRTQAPLLLISGRG